MRSFSFSLFQIACRRRRRRRRRGRAVSAAVTAFPSHFAFAHSPTFTPLYGHHAVFPLVPPSEVRTATTTTTSTILHRFTTLYSILRYTTSLVLLPSFLSPFPFPLSHHSHFQRCASEFWKYRRGYILVPKKLKMIGEARRPFAELMRNIYQINFKTSRKFGLYVLHSFRLTTSLGLKTRFCHSHLFFLPLLLCRPKGLLPFPQVSSSISLFLLLLACLALLSPAALIFFPSPSLPP